MSGSADGPVPFHYPAPDYYQQLLSRPHSDLRGQAIFMVSLVQRPSWVLSGVAEAWRTSAVLGTGARSVRAGDGTPGLIVQQIYNTGARSLVIIMLSGLFLGMVLGLQGYDLLQRFDSTSALGEAAALSLIKELGAAITALLFAGRRRHRDGLGDWPDGRD